MLPVAEAKLAPSPPPHADKAIVKMNIKDLNMASA
jgi:hypothetical protein